jgi:hypothetical protein
LPQLRAGLRAASLPVMRGRRREKLGKSLVTEIIAASAAAQ